MHFVWIDSGKTAMPLDVQFFRERNNLFLTDAEVATYGNSSSWEFFGGQIMKTINNDEEIIFPGTPESEMTEAFVRIDSGKTAMPLFLTDFETAPYM